MMSKIERIINKMARIFGNGTSLKIILSFDIGKRYSFNYLKKVCDACSPSVNYSLMVLVKEGVIRRVEVSKRPKRVYYELTDYGKKCLKVIKKFFSIHKNR